MCPQCVAGPIKDQTFSALDIDFDHVHPGQPWSKLSSERVCTRSNELSELMSPRNGEILPLLVAWP